MNQVPSTYDFTQLQLLPFVTLQLETLLPYIADHSILYHFLRKKIMRFNLDIELEKTKIFERELCVFELILEWAKHLIDFTFSNRLRVISDPDLSISTCASSILTKATINVDTFDDCLCLILDGRFTR
ncbi:unnamed protein product [Rotaria socialis]|uniref:Uncharacterized protein n=1 Tax=Rotaria socialis TaxID=392032 RepID=A0A821DJT0_9BILA|nr:unnamed protein product [Rotaria socialis]CAF4622097.1 unnamed protein product [Rotaria socialis]